MIPTRGFRFSEWITLNPKAIDETPAQSKTQSVARARKSAAATITGR
jgi:hypothetical protein